MFLPELAIECYGCIQLITGFLVLIKTLVRQSPYSQ